MRVVDFARAVVRDAEAAVLTVDFEKGDREREVEYTQGWLRQLLPRRVRLELGLESADFRCVSGIGPSGDDAVVFRGVVEGSRVLVVDSRVLVLVVSPGDEIDGVESVFQKFVDFDQPPAGRAVWSLNRLRTPGADEAGTIEVDRGQRSTWFAKPIVWGTGDRGSYIFVLEKVCLPPTSRIPHPLEAAPRFADGIPVGDPRTYRRFADSNREELAREKFLEMQQRPRVEDRLPGVKGLRAGTPNDR